MKIEMETDPYGTATIIDRSVCRYLIKSPDARADYWYRVSRYVNGQMWFNRDVPVVGQAVAGAGNPAKPLKVGSRVTVDGAEYELGKNLFLFRVVPIVVTG